MHPLVRGISFFSKDEYMEVITFGGGERLRATAQAFPKYLKDREKYSSVSRVIILPIPSTRDGKLVTGTGITLNSVLSEVSGETLVAGWGLPREWCDAVVRRRGRVYDASLDEELVEENARLTAIGALGRILTDNQRAPEDLSIGVIGWGRIGKLITRYLLFLGARVRVYTTSPKVREELSSLGIETRDTYLERDYTSLDVIVNTAPARVICESDAASLPPHVKIMELASGNGLDGVPRVTKFPSIPEAMYPHSAGEIYAEYIAMQLCREVSL